MARKTSSYMRKEMRDHQLNVEVVRALAADPELKYYLGVAAGSGVAWVSSLLNKATDGTTSSGTTTIGTGGTVGLTWLMGPLNPALAQTLWDKIQSGGDANTTVGNVLGLVGGGFAGFCAAVLILRALHGGGDGEGGGILSGII